MKYCELALLLCGSMSQHQNLQMELKTLFFPVANCKVRCHVVVGIECNNMHSILCTHRNVVWGFSMNVQQICTYSNIVFWHFYIDHPVISREMRYTGSSCTAM